MSHVDLLVKMRHKCDIERIFRLRKWSFLKLSCLYNWFWGIFKEIRKYLNLQKKSELKDKEKIKIKIKWENGVMENQVCRYHWILRSKIWIVHWESK